MPEEEKKTGKIAFFRKFLHVYFGASGKKEKKINTKRGRKITAKKGSCDSVKEGRGGNSSPVVVPPLFPGQSCTWTFK